MTKLEKNAKTKEQSDVKLSEKQQVIEDLINSENELKSERHISKDDVENHCSLIYGALPP
jgi:chromosome condensin MukBEF MukE localization factor